MSFVSTPHHRAPIRLLAACVALAMIAGCSSEEPAAPAVSATSPAVTGPAAAGSDAMGTSREPTLLPSACADPSVPEDRFTCEVLVLPEDRAIPDGRQVELPVVRTGTPADDPGSVGGAASPVVVLHGGPGGGAVQDWATWGSVLDDLGMELVLYDQRGGGRAVPRLDCPEHTGSLLGALGRTDGRDREHELVAAAVRSCHERLTDSGVDLDSYDTPTSTLDLEDLRLAIGADRLTLVASSYGTRLALDYLRTHPDRVRALVLDSVDPPERTGESTVAGSAERSVARLLDACASDEACAGAHPDLGARLERVLGRFDESPRRVTVDDTQGSPVELTLDGDDLYAGLFAAMYDTEVIPLLPSLIGSIAAGDETLIDTMASRVVQSTTSNATGAFLSVDCADSGAPRAAPAPGRAATLALADSLTFCTHWSVEPVPDAFSRPVPAEDAPPTLVVAGELDPITPAAHAEEVARRLGAHHVEVPRGGHSPMLVDPCARDVLRSFLSDPDRPALGCLGSLAPVPFS
jgi:pimeloyl-ACP methyl ester carboxylesterase